MSNILTSDEKRKAKVLSMLLTAAILLGENSKSKQTRNVKKKPYICHGKKCLYSKKAK